MEINLTADIQAKLSKLAIARGSNAEILAQEAIERYVEYDEWFVREVDKGLAQIDEGEVLSHAEVGRRLETLLSRKQSRL